ncbi:hypothetical protein [Alishewanella longhuensis]
MYHSASSRQLAARLLLHASNLYFDHPLTGERQHGHVDLDFNDFSKNINEINVMKNALTYWL